MFKRSAWLNRRRQMEPPKGFSASLWNFIRFLPYFIGLLFLGTIKGFIFCPLICLIMGIGNSGIIVGLWPAHSFYTYYCIFRAKQLGPGLKLVLSIFVLPPLAILWPVVGIVGSVLGGVAYGFLSPIYATFDAVGEGKTNELFHCFYDGTWSTVEGCLTVVRDFYDVCFHSYFSVMDDLRHGSPEDKYYDIRLFYLPGAFTAGLLGVILDLPVISFIAVCKSVFMLFKGWHRLFQDLIGREGPFLETICVPFAGLAILLWPLVVVGAVLASIISSIFLGAFAGLVVYQESSFWLGLCYIVASLSIYDEYSNDILGMPEGSWFPRPHYRKKHQLAQASGRSASFSRPNSFKYPSSRGGSFKNPMIELKPLELLDGVFKDCQSQGQIMVSEGLITFKDIEDAKSSKGSRVIDIGLPALSILQILLRSAKSNSSGLLLSDNVTEITNNNRPKDTYFDWFFQPLLIIKDQIKAENLSDEEEAYFCRLVLLIGDPVRLKSSNIGSPPESERKRAELEALARRLQGITKSISRFPTFRRRFDSLVDSISEYLAEKDINELAVEPRRMFRSKSAFARLFSQKSLKIKTSNDEYDLESRSVRGDVETGPDRLI